MSVTRVLVVVLSLMLPTVVCATQPILNLTDVKVPAKIDGSAYSVDEVRAAIIAGCRIKGWTPQIAGPSTVSANILVKGKHYAEIEIHYTQTAYSIRYVSSKNLDYDEKTQEIHRNYNKWITLLSKAIQSQIGVAR